MKLSYNEISSLSVLGKEESPSTKEEDSDVALWRGHGRAVDSPIFCDLSQDAVSDLLHRSRLSEHLGIIRTSSSEPGPYFA